MRYKISDLLDEDGNLKKVPKGYAVIEFENSKKVMFINIEKNLNILLVKVYKNIYAARISHDSTVKYKFLRYHDELINSEKGENYMIKALNEIIRKVEERFDVEKSKDILYSLYLVRGCIKGNKSSCSELEDYVDYENAIE